MKITIIGGGPGGYTAAFDAADRGHEVVLIEKCKIGGTCLNRGCIPTKTMRASADALEVARKLPAYGIKACGEAAPEPGEIRKRLETVRNTLGQGLLKSCQAKKIRYVEGDAVIVDKGHVKVGGKDGKEEVIEGDAIIIATGSGILQLPGLPFDHEVVCDSDDALEIKKIPGHLCIVGGGVIGCELAAIYRAFGSEVTIVEGQDRLLPLPSVDADISALLQREFKKKKIKMLTGKTLTDLEVKDGKAHAKIAISPFVNKPDDGKREDMEAEMIFVTVGRKAEGGALGKSGVATDKRGWVIVDSHLKTNIDGIYAIGDILGPGHIMLAHVASMEGLCAVANICGEKWEMNYSVVPSAIFTEPEIGTVGLTEAQAKEKCGDVITATVQMRELGKAQAMAELPGFFKLIADGETGKLLGAQIAGVHASDMVAEAALAMQAGLSVKDIAKTIHPHPTLSEGLFEAARIAAAKCKG